MAKNEGGRPPTYQPEFNELAYKVCAEFGADDKRLARFLGVSKSTINNWKKEHDGFLDSLKKGKDCFDSNNCEKSLLQRALGYDYDETHTEISDKDGIQRKVVKKVKRHVSADVGANIFWLCNRHPERWKHVQRIEHSGPGGGPIETSNSTITADVSNKEAMQAYMEMLKYDKP